ncbi:MAG: gamma-glutamyltransferase family protein, partial [Rhodospirillales bacterium]
MFTTRPEIVGTHGVVASTHWIASQVGMAMLERGGNAFDAAVAAGFTLEVVEPHLNGPGGDMPALIHAARENRVRVICGQGVTPEAATIERVRAMGLDLIPGTGLLPAVVPGAVDAWLMMLQDHGTMSLIEVLTPAILYARNGFPVMPRIEETLGQVAEMFRQEWPSSAELWLKDGKPPAAGTMIRNPVLADTFARLAAAAEGGGRTREQRIGEARRAWREGFVAEAIDRFCRDNEVMDASGSRHRGLLTGQDMARWRPSYEAPLTLDYHRYTVCKCGPWSQGPSMLQTLALLRGFDLGAMDPLGAEFVHAVTESFKLAFADREAFYGDPNFVEVPLERLLSAEYADERRTLIGREASRELRPGSIPGHGGPVLQGAAAAAGLTGHGAPAGGAPP